MLRDLHSGLCVTLSLFRLCSPGYELCEAGTRASDRTRQRLRCGFWIQSARSVLQWLLDSQLGRQSLQGSPRWTRWLTVSSEGCFSSVDVAETAFMYPGHPKSVDHQTVVPGSSGA